MGTKHAETALSWQQQAQSSAQTSPAASRLWGAQGLTMLAHRASWFLRKIFLRKKRAFFDPRERQEYANQLHDFRIGGRYPEIWL